MSWQWPYGIDDLHPILVLKQVYSLEKVMLRNPGFLCSFQESRYVLHLHEWYPGHLEFTVSGLQLADQSEDNGEWIWGQTYQVQDQNRLAAYLHRMTPSLRLSWKSSLGNDSPMVDSIHSRACCSRSTEYLLCSLSWISAMTSGPLVLHIALLSQKNHHIPLSKPYSFVGDDMFKWMTTKSE